MDTLPQRIIIDLKYLHIDDYRIYIVLFILT